MVEQVVEDVKQAHNAVGNIPTAALLALIARDAKVEGDREILLANATGPPKPSLAGEWGRKHGLLAEVPLPHARSFAQDILPLARVSNAVYEKDFVIAVIRELDDVLGIGRAEVLHSHGGGFRIPCHCVVVDRSNRRIVVAIRGTAEAPDAAINIGKYQWHQG